MLEHVQIFICIIIISVDMIGSVGTTDRTCLKVRSTTVGRVPRSSILLVVSLVVGTRSTPLVRIHTGCNDTEHDLRT